MKTHINNAIRAATAKVDEIFLFNELLNYLNNNGTLSCFVKSVHAHAGFIDFQSNITGKVEKVEIADLMIINHNLTLGETRLCFVQAKYKKQNYRQFVSFAGDAIQWDLLSRRPTVTDTYKNGFPQDVLSFTKFKTITSYGLFYKDRSGLVDLLFTLPEHLHPRSRKKKTTLNFPGYYWCPSASCPGIDYQDEMISVCSMHGFESALLGGRIGAPISAAVRPYIGSLLRSMRLRNPHQAIETMLRSGDFQDDTSIENINNINALIIVSGEHHDSKQRDYPEPRA